MSIWKQLRNSAVKGAGFAAGASAGRDLYNAAKKKVGDVDWEKVREDAEGAVDRLSQSAQTLASNLQEQVAPQSAPQSTTAEEAVRQAEELLREAGEAAEVPTEPITRTL